VGQGAACADDHALGQVQQQLANVLDQAFWLPPNVGILGQVESAYKLEAISRRREASSLMIRVALLCVCLLSWVAPASAEPVACP
jgi:hypothetical protein